MDLNGDFPSLERLVPLMPGHVYLLDRNGICRGCNDLQAKALGLSSNIEAVGKKIAELPAFKNQPDLVSMLESNNLTVMESATPHEFEEPGIDLNGLKKIFRSHKIPIFNENKQVIGLLGISYDISDSKRKYEALQQQHESAALALSNIMANLPDHVYWVDINNIVLGCNELQAHGSGLKSPTEAIGMNVTAFQTPENAEAVIQNNLKVTKEGKTIVEEENFVTPSGESRTFLSKKVPLRDKEGHIVGLLGISSDITELKATQEREKKAIAEAADEAATKRAIMVFSGMIAHDLRTPLATARMGAVALNQRLPGLIETYQKASEAELEIPFLPSSFLKDLAQIPGSMIEAIQEANAYIDASLKSLKVASQGGDLLSKEQLVLCDAERLLRRSVKDYPYKSGDEAKVHLNTEVTFNFMGNEIFVSRLFENLMKNAFEQIQLKGKGEIFIQTELNDAFHHIKIKDTAGGVTQSIIDQVNQAEMKSTKEGGTGVGLSSAKHTMEALGGKIEAHLVDADCIEFVLSFPAIEK